MYGVSATGLRHCGRALISPVMFRTVCAAGQKWRWDGVDFEFLHPGPATYASDNDGSCVLRVGGSGGRVLLDADVQAAAESELVALDPRNGEVLAFVSKPTFDPNLFVEGIDVDSWRELNDSIDKPLLNRALRGTYPPGSTFKPFMALAALYYGKRTPSQTISDPGYFMFGGHRFRDSREGGNGIVDLYKSIVVSSDTYYYMVANDLGIDNIAAYMSRFGFGAKSGIDLLGESKIGRAHV